ncbi:MAG: pseudouridine synthase [Oceanipulchritudo sp.]
MEEEKPVRIQKVIADRGLASRREAEGWISEGRVRVNGTIAVLGGTCFPSRDRIEVDDAPLPRREPPKMVLAMNKPKGFLCTNDDPHASRTVFDLLTPEFAEYRLFCVGRLDKDSEGLILLTNDGKLKQRLTHPSYNVAKKYSVELDKPLQEKDLPKLMRGINWEGERLSLDRVFPLKGRGKENWKLLEVTLHHGRKREIRRLFYAFGYDVRKLRREQIGRFQLKGLPRGTFRTLSTSEVRLLFQAPAPEGRS